MKAAVLRFVLTCLVGASVAPAAEKAAPAARAVRVHVEPVDYTTEAVPVRVVGVLARKREAELSFKIGGLVAEVNVRVGDRVTRGQVLARLRTDEIDAQVTQARSGLAKAQRDLARLETLVANRVATLENVQDARTAVEVAQAAVRIAEFNRAHAAIEAPEDGLVLRRRSEPGELVAPGAPIVGFASEREGWLVRAALAERELAQVAPGDAVTVTAAGETVTGRVVQIAEASEAATRTTPIEVALERVPARARSGGVAVAVVQPRPVPARARVAASALLEGDGATASVFLVAEGATTAQRVRVEVERLVGDRALLRTELPRTARVVVRGAEYLRDGAAVEPGR
jgi:RND family efflux transporter MFP subunit